MNNIELIAIKELEKELWEAADRCNEKNAERMNDERIFILGNIKRALDVIKAMKDNSPNYKP